MIGSTTAASVRIPDYELLRLVGRGAYGDVWMARNALGSLYAVKVVWRRSFEDDRPYEREFHGIRKFEPVSRKHDGLVDIFHVGRNNEGGYFYYVMELADDARFRQEADSVEDYRPLTLREELRTRGRMPIARVLETGAKLASALDYLHRAGLVHRDVKPSNIILVGGVPKLADMGLVAGISDARSYVGTEGFVPPEGPGSAAADIFSLGKVLYEISTGLDRNEFPRLPAVGGDTGLAVEEIAEFNEILLKACDPSHKARYRTAGELFGELVFLQGGKSLRRVRGLERRTAFLSRLGLAAAIVAVVASLGYFGSFKQIQRAIRAERQAVAHVELLEMQKAEELFRRDDAGGAIACLAHIIRSNPTNRVAIERLLSALTWRNLPLPAVEPAVPEARLRVAAGNPDGRDVVSGSANGMLQFWDWATGGLTAEFKAAASDVLALDWSNDRSLLAIGTVEGGLLHDLVTDQLLPLPGPPDVRVEIVKLSPDLQWVVTAGDDGITRIWDARTGQPTGTTLSHGGRIHRIAFSPDSQSIATAGLTDGAVRIWNIKTSEPQTPILRHGNRVNEIVFSPDGRTLASASEDGSAGLWRAVDGMAMGRLGHRAQVSDVAFSRDGQRLVTASEDGTAILWDLQTLQPIGAPMPHRASVRQAEFSPDELKLVTVSEDNMTRLWDAMTAEPISEPMRHSHAVLSAGFSPGGDRLLTGVSAAEGSGLWFWKTTVRKARGLEFAAERGNRFARLLDRPGSLCIVSDRTMRRMASDDRAEPATVDFGVPVDLFSLAATGDRAVVVYGNKFWVWDMETREPIMGPIPASASIVAADFSPDGRRLAIATLDARLTLWRLQPEVKEPVTLSCLPLPGRVATRLEDGIFSVRFSPDGRFLVAGCRDQKGRIFDAISGRLAVELPHEHWVTSAEFSPDSRQVVTASSDQSAQVWDVATGQPVGSPMRHDNEVLTARFSPDGRRIATAARDWTARVWDARTGAPISAPLTHAGLVQVVSFSPDGIRVATGSADATARIWDAETGSPLTDPFRFQGSIQDVAFSADGSRLLVVPATGSIQLLEVLQPNVPAPGWLPELAEAVAGQRVNSRKVTEPVPPARLFALKREIDALLESRPAVRWAKWYLSDPDRRPVSPTSALDRSAHVDGLIRSGSIVSLKEAVWLEPTNALAHAYLARAILRDEPKPAYRDMAAANWHQNHARKLQPDNHEVEEVCARVRLRIRGLTGTSSNRVP